MTGVLAAVVDWGKQTGQIRTEDSAGQIAEFLMISQRGLVYN